MIERNVGAGAGNRSCTRRSTIKGQHAAVAGWPVDDRHARSGYVEVADEHRRQDRLRRRDDRYLNRRVVVRVGAALGRLDHRDADIIRTVNNQQVAIPTPAS